MFHWRQHYQGVSWDSSMCFLTQSWIVTLLSETVDVKPCISPERGRAWTICSNQKNYHLTTIDISLALHLCSVIAHNHFLHFYYISFQSRISVCLTHGTRFSVKLSVLVADWLAVYLITATLLITSWLSHKESSLTWEQVSDSFFLCCWQ